MTREQFRPRLLTPGERKYMLDAALGLTAQQSAHKNGVTREGVLTMRRRAKQVLGASNITHAVFLAIAYGDLVAHADGTITSEGTQTC